MVWNLGVGAGLDKRIRPVPQAGEDYCIEWSLRGEAGPCTIGKEGVTSLEVQVRQEQVACQVRMQTATSE